MSHWSSYTPTLSKRELWKKFFLSSLISYSKKGSRTTLFLLAACRRGRKESWVPKYWCFWIVVSEKTLESPLDCKEIQPVHPAGNQSWLSIGRADDEAETLILWPPDANNWLIGKDPDSGKDWRWEEKGMREDEMVGWHHWLEGHEFEQAPGVGDGQGSLAYCSSWGYKELDMTERLNLTELRRGKRSDESNLFSLSRANHRDHGHLASYFFLFQLKHMVDDCSESVNVGLLQVWLTLLSFPANTGKAE